MSEAANVPQPRRRRLLDTDTKEAVLYGTSATTVRMYDIEIEHELEILERMISEAWSKIDLEIADIILKKYPESPYTETIPPSMNDCFFDTLFDLKEIVRSEWARAWFNDRLARIHKTGRAVGSTEHSLRILDNYSEDVWRAAAILDQHKVEGS